MFRGRLVAINSRAVSLDDYPDERAKGLVDREFNLSNASQPPTHNSISAGRWTPGGRRRERRGGHCQDPRPEAGRPAAL